MARRTGLRLTISGPARRDIAGILAKSLEEFGEAAAGRYRALIRQALFDIQCDPERPGSVDRQDILADGARTYHIAHSRARTGGARVNRPRHFLLYRCRADGVVEVARVLHEARDLERHLPDEYRRN